jgi:uncharacterized Zn-binding protein involved in type VI secretion
MPGIARKDGKDTVKTNHKCDSTTVTDTGSPNVFANGTGVVRKNDRTKPHKWPRSGCSNHTPILTTHSPNVFANGLPVGRKGDSYQGETLITGSNNVFVNGG